MTQIAGIQRLEDTTVRSGHGDNWHMTWADNGKQYVGLCDGTGWDDIEGYTGQPYNTRVYAIEGQPPEHRFEHLSGFPDLATQNRYYGFGILALDGCIYNYLSTPDFAFGPPGNTWRGAKLIYSSDNGCRWLNQDGSTLRWEDWQERNRENMVFYDEPGRAFSLLTVLQMGRNYEHNRDGYVYVYAPNGNEEGTMNQLVMFRVRKHQVLERSAYEYFVSADSNGGATWSKDIDRCGVVHTFPAGWVNWASNHPYAWHPSVAYNAPMGQYMMVNWGMGVSEQGQWFGKPSYLGFWVASNPWGPWTQVHEETAWVVQGDTAGRNYQPQIAPTWIARDGRSFWLVFTDFRNRGKKPYYGFNCQKVKILTR